ncbi:MAG: hypothetical protein MK137_06915 [Rickettsiales bacterium]|nr:hypothetical protein [Rickettsiales bacterium]
MDEIEIKVSELLVLLSKQAKYTSQYTESDKKLLKEIESLLSQCNGMLSYLERSMMGDNEQGNKDKNLHESKKYFDPDLIDYY